jgi:hypothetical protein
MKGFFCKLMEGGAFQNARKKVKYFSCRIIVQISGWELKLNRLKLTIMRQGFNAHGKMHGDVRARAPAPGEEKQSRKA